jgi:hypothetical protein
MDIIKKKVGIYNYTKLDGSKYFTSLYKPDNRNDVFYIKIENNGNRKNRDLQIPNFLDSVKGGNNNCGLRTNAYYDSRVDYSFINAWSSKNNLSWSVNQDGYFLNNKKYNGPYSQHSKECTDGDNHIHIFKAVYKYDYTRGRHNLIILYSQKNNGIPILVEYNKYNKASIKRVSGSHKNYIYYGESRSRELLNESAITYFKRLLFLAKKLDVANKYDYEKGAYIRPYIRPRNQVPNLVAAPANTLNIKPATLKSFPKSVPKSATPKSATTNPVQL